MNEEPTTLPADGALPNPEIKDPETTVEPQVTPTEPDYKEKFSASTREAQRLAAELKARDEEIERLRKISESGASYGDDPENINLYPGFETLGPDEQKNLLDYTNNIKKQVLDQVSKNPEIAFAKKTYNEHTWESAFSDVASEYPELNDPTEKKAFKDKYFKADNVPSNIKDILKDLAKIHLFDKAKDIGAKQAAEQASRIDIERANGGDKTPTAARSLEDWSQMASSNPAKFAKLSKEFNADMESGKLK